MAGDSAELTFVRCPHCRSLVPATSKTCRMCGESMDAHAKDDAESKKSSRIRQRTMSRPSEMLQETAEKIRGESAVPVKAATSSASNTPANTALGDDLMEALGLAPNKQEAPKNDFSYCESNPFESEAAAEEEVDPLGAYIQELQMGDANKNKPVVKQAAPAIPLPTAPVSQQIPKQFVSEVKAAVSGIPPTPPVPAPTEPVMRFDVSAPAAEPVNEVKPKVIVESGSRRAIKSGLSFARPKDHAEAAPQVEPTPAAAPKVETDFRAQEVEAKVTHEEKKIVREESSPARVVTSAKPQKPIQEVSGRLVGWLVSYTNPDGEAYELREGKFFVSRTSLKPSDFIIDDESVSTPHALVMVTADAVLRVQDLMSERGVFVRRAGADTYQRAAEIIEVKTGDWLRFGDIEYLLCLVAHVGVK